MKFKLVRDSSGNWWDINDTFVLLGFPACSAKEIVEYVRKLFPEATIFVDNYA